jgi:hypothetical protein
MPAWVLAAAFFGAALLLAPVLFHAWLDRFLADRRAHTEALAARARDAERSRTHDGAAPDEARVDDEKAAVLDDRPLR